MNNKIVSVILCVAVLNLYGCGRNNEIRVNGIRMDDPGGSVQTEVWRQTEDAGAAELLPEDESDSELAVYVCGAVERPSVCHLEPGARVCDAIEAAGGFAKDADTQWLNQARLLRDEEMIIVYTEDETSQMKNSSSGDVSGAGICTADQASADASSGRINLNTASRQQLMTLPGIGESKAGSIIRYREENGPFSCIEDVMNISGIKDSVYSQIRDHITV